MGGCKQFTSCKRSRRNLLGKLESYQRGFNWNIPFKCRRLKPWFDFFQRISEKWKSRQILIFLRCGCSGNSRGNPWSLITSLRFVRLPSPWPCHGWDSSCWPRQKTLFWGGSQITADGDCSHEIKRCLLLRRNVMTCREPAWGIPPMTRSWGRKPDKMQGCDQASGVPPGISWACTPTKNQKSAGFCNLLFHFSDILWNKVNSGL